ncbi:uncharacterized protein Dwil_GK13181 [Drosophila willistoni]|uniref:Uncharacterized protein n=2 Tax=Drosophila willistoni TaxID=7260 RepID=A0A0Q9WV47_DROWI|nr:uncharacterized protein Dwil_GK13181 [Drosophila willistoni]
MGQLGSHAQPVEDQAARSKRYDWFSSLFGDFYDDSGSEEYLICRNCTVVVNSQTTAPIAATTAAPAATTVGPAAASAAPPMGTTAATPATSPAAGAPATPAAAPPGN